MGADITMTGPLYDGTAADAVTDFLDATTRDLADLGLNEVQSRLRSVLKDPTGHYMSKVTTDRASTDRVEITDNGVIYGPWLEGTSSRNKTTRFKGYSTFRRTVQWLEGQVDNVAGTHLGRAMPRMGGDT